MWPTLRSAIGLIRSRCHQLQNVCRTTTTDHQFGDAHWKLHSVASPVTRTFSPSHGHV
jgi:hypothetical protein